MDIWRSQGIMACNRADDPHISIDLEDVILKLPKHQVEEMNILMFGSVRNMNGATYEA
jgi:hypothetical protein